MLKAEDRVRRIGQLSAVTSIWIQANELDKQVDNMLQRKKSNVDTVISAASVCSTDKSGSSDDCDQLLIRMVEQVIPSLLECGSTVVDDEKNGPAIVVQNEASHTIVKGQKHMKICWALEDDRFSFENKREVHINIANERINKRTNERASERTNVRTN